MLGFEWRSLQDFKWRVVDWHYQFYMGPKAGNAHVMCLAESRHAQPLCLISAKLELLRPSDCLFRVLES